jgi:hypothetical protein
MMETVEPMAATPTPMSTTPSMLVTGAPPAYAHDGAAMSGADLKRHQRGRDKLPWSNEIWQRLDCAIHDECKRTRVAAQFLPIIKVPEYTTTVSTDAFSQDTTQSLVVAVGSPPHDVIILGLSDPWRNPQLSLMSRVTRPRLLGVRTDGRESWIHRMQPRPQRLGPANLAQIRAAVLSGMEPSV